MTRGKIVLVPFPFDDLTAQKARPAVCLTDPLAPIATSCSRLLPVGSQTNRLPAMSSWTPKNPNFGDTGLQARSTLRVHRLVTVASNVVKRELGRLSPTMEGRVTDAVRRLFGC